MREILFRGKRADTKEWVEGYHFMGFTGIPYILVLHDHILRMTEFYEVIPETVGQFTGLLDKNGKKIFEGDKIKLTQGRGTVEWSKTQGRFVIWLPKSNKFVSLLSGTAYEVIGNIYDNPNLMKEKKNGNAERN